MAPPRLGFVPPPRRWEQGRTTRPVGACPVGRLPTLPPLYPPGGLPSLPPTAPAFSLAFCPHPPNPLPLRGRGSPKVYFAGGFAPGTPTLNRPRHLQTLPSSPPPGTAKRRSSQCRVPSSPGDARGEAPCIRKTKISPFPGGEGGAGGWGQKIKLKAGVAGGKEGKPPAGTATARSAGDQPGKHPRRAPPTPAEPARLGQAPPPGTKYASCSGASK